MDSYFALCKWDELPMFSSWLSYGNPPMNLVKAGASGSLLCHRNCASVSLLQKRGNSITHALKCFMSIRCDCVLLLRLSGEGLFCLFVLC